MKDLDVSKTLALPSELAARTQAILAMKGMGKTYLAMKETEEMLKRKQQVCCLDPTGVWYGLRSSADGKSDGFPILVFGGDNADVPLEPTAGEYLADFVQDGGRSVIFDMSHFESLAAQDRFVTDFAIRLYRRKAKADSRNTIHLMLDEADSFAPQKPAKNQLKMLGAWEAIVRRGRSRGIGLTMITQRPAVINKNVLSQVDLLVCLRIVGIHDFKAVKEWTDLYATPEQKAQFMESLPKLETGEAWFWSPGWLRIFQKAVITPKVTFDSSRTPEPGHKATAPKKMSIDLSELTDQIRATVEQAKANDPKELRKELNQVRQQLQTKSRELEQQIGNVQVSEIVKEVQVIKEGEIERIERLEGRMMAAGKEAKAAADEFWKEVQALNATLNSAGVAAMHPNNRGMKLAPVKSSSSPSRGLALPQKAEVGKVYKPIAPDGAIQPNTAEQRILNSLGWWDRANVPAPTRHMVAFGAKFKVGGYFTNTLGAMKTKGLIDYPQPGVVKLTGQGQAQVDPSDEIPTRSNLLSNVLEILPSAQSKIFKALITQGETDRGTLANRAGLNIGGYFTNMLGAMRTAGVIEYPSPGMVKLASLFEALN